MVSAVRVWTSTQTQSARLMPSCGIDAVAVRAVDTDVRAAAEAQGPRQAVRDRMRQALRGGVVDALRIVDEHLALGNAGGDVEVVGDVAVLGFSVSEKAQPAGRRLMPASRRWLRPLCIGLRTFVDERGELVGLAHTLREQRLPDRLSLSPGGAASWMGVSNSPARRADTDAVLGELARQGHRQPEQRRRRRCTRPARPALPRRARGALVPRLLRRR